ncbi:MAG: hypothetical protein RLO03_05285 [Balneola sp.]
MDPLSHINMLYAYMKVFLYCFCSVIIFSCSENEKLNLSFTQTSEEAIPNGNLLTLSYKAGNDANYLSTAIIESDKSLECGTIKKDSYLPRPLFTIHISCKGSTDTLRYLYNGYNQKVEYLDTTYDVSELKLLIAVMKEQGSFLLQFKNENEDFDLPIETQSVLLQKFPNLIKSKSGI